MCYKEELISIINDLTDVDILRFIFIVLTDIITAKARRDSENAA